MRKLISEYCHSSSVGYGNPVEDFQYIVYTYTLHKHIKFDSWGWYISSIKLQLPVDFKEQCVVQIVSDGKIAVSTSTPDIFLSGPCKLLR